MKDFHHYLLYLLACILWHSRLVNGEIRSGSMPVHPLVLDSSGFTEFGFQQNGTVSMFISALPQDVPLYLVICSENDQPKFGYQAEEMCASLYTGVKVCQVTELFKDQLRLFYSFPRYGYYYFNLVNCYDKVANVDIYATFLNPGGNHLTAREVPAPAMYSVMTAVWIGATLGWSTHVAAWWKASVALHRVMIFYPALKVLYSWAASHYYTYASVHGRSTPSNDLLYMGSYILFQLVFNFILLVLSRGWGISKANLKSEKYLIFSILACFFVVMMLHYMYSKPSQLLGLMIALAIIGFRVTIVVYVFMGVNTVIRQLETAMYNYNIDVQNIDSHYTLIKRHKIYVCNLRLRAEPNLFIPVTQAPTPTDGNHGTSTSESGDTPGPEDSSGIEMTTIRTTRPHLHNSSSESSIDIVPAAESTYSNDNEATENADMDGDDDEVVLINKHR